MTDVFASFVTPLLAHFHEPTPEFLIDLAKELRPFADDVLAEAACRLKRTHNRSTFPRLSECLKACEDAMAAKALSGPPRPAGAEPEVFRWAEQQARARKLLTGTSIAREAARDGWFPGLWDFAAEQGRIPAAAQVPALRKRAIESHQIVLDSQNHPMVGKLARSMVTRYARIEAEVAA